MDKNDSTAVQKIAEAASNFQLETTGHRPTAVSVVLSDETLVITMHDALSPAERALSKSSEGANKVQDFHRELFASSSEAFRKKIELLTGRQVREAAAEVEPATGTIVHAFTTGTMIQVFLLEPSNE